MPMRACKHPTCTAYVSPTFKFCPRHADRGQKDRVERDRQYDRDRRNPAAKEFYNTAAWKRVRQDVLAAHPVCRRCLCAFASHVHHVIPLSRCTPEQKIDPANLLAVCPPCHNAIEGEADR